MDAAGYQHAAFSARKTSPFVNGAPQFVENRTGPPSRAYLKLWKPARALAAGPPNERCYDLGATPGGWTWAIANLGAQVTAFDRAPLDSKVATMPGVSFQQASAFGLEPEKLAAVDWMFSDIIAYPQRLYGLRKTGLLLATPTTLC